MSRSGDEMVVPGPGVVARRTQHDRRNEAEQRLLIAAAQLIGDRGLAGTTLAAVGVQAGYSRGIVGHHFGSKAALIRRLAQTTQEQFVLSVRASLTSDDELAHVLALLAAYLHGMRVGPQSAGPPTPRRAFQRAFVVMWGESASVAADLRPVFAEGDARSRTLIRELLRAGQARGRVRADADVDSVAAILIAQVRGLALQVLVDPDALDLDAVTQLVLDGARHMLAPG